jgi:hypothetical protein
MSLGSAGAHPAQLRPAARQPTSHRLTLDPGKNYGDIFKDGVVPVGDGKYKTDVAKQGYFDACAQYAQSLANGGGGADVRGPWFEHHNKDYDIDAKVAVEGKVQWSAKHSVTLHGSKRVITTNDLPRHSTGVFPIRSTDPAYKYDRNPNTIKAQSISLTLPAHPSYRAPQCAGGVAGYMTTGVMLFSAFDAGGRDAGAWEVQDHCDAHPEPTGTYHYHTLSSCIHNIGVHHVIGWALDGFPITGPDVSKRNVLTTRDLDVCHGITSKVTIDGKSVTTYHYVMTQDFPYSVSCYRGTPVTTGPV